MSEHNTNACEHGHRDPPPRRPDRSIADADRRRRPSADVALPRVRSHIFPPSRACPHPPQTHPRTTPHSPRRDRPRPPPRGRIARTHRREILQKRRQIELLLRRRRERRLGRFRLRRDRSPEGRSRETRRVKITIQRHRARPPPSAASRESSRGVPEIPKFPSDRAMASGIREFRIREHMDVRVGRLRACRSVDAWVDGS